MNFLITKEELYKELRRIHATRSDRLKYAHIVLNDMTLFPKLIEILCMVDDKVSCRAAWVLEFVCTEYLYAIVPYLDTFTTYLKKIHLDSAVRPVAKVCVLIAEAFYSKHLNTIQKALKPIHQEYIVEACFDWMITNRKTAAKVYAMETLFLFGKNNGWIHTELEQILKRDFQNQSSGFKARARHILSKINKKSNYR